jgi:hypothetical protein
MGANNADISRNMFDELKRYQQLVYQQGKPVVDADFNDSEKIIYTLLRRFIKTIIGDGSPDLGFKIEANGSSNDIRILGGNATLEGAGRLLVGGYQCFLPDLRWYKGTDNIECTPVSTDLIETVLTDTAANFTLGGADDNLVGRTLVPDITKPTFTYTITANTQNTITVIGSMLAAGIKKAEHYRVELSAPVGSDRTDEAYIDVYLDEINGEEDEDLKHTLGMQIETHRRLKLIQNVFVAQGAVTPDRYVDFDGNQHETLRLATIQRYDSQDALSINDVTDQRPIFAVLSDSNHSSLYDMPSGSNTDHDERYAQIEAGTKMVFFQAAAPTGWTQDATHNDKMLRVVSGPGGGSGGSVSPILHDHEVLEHDHTVDAHSHTVNSHVHGMNSHTHTVASHTHSIPSHQHTMNNHTHTVSPHTLSIDEMPSHSHSFSHRQTHIDEGDDAGKDYIVPGGTTNTNSKGGSQAHDHGTTGSATGSTGYQGGTSGGKSLTTDPATGNTESTVGSTTSDAGNTGMKALTSETVAQKYVDMILCTRD